jgi:hypothetical protein
MFGLALVLVRRHQEREANESSQQSHKWAFPKRRMNPFGVFQVVNKSESLQLALLPNNLKSSWLMNF